MSRPQDKRFCIDDAFEEELEPAPTPQPPRSLDLSCRTYKCPEDTISKDSDSLIHDYMPVNEGEINDVYCWNHPKVRENWKTIGVAIGLLVFGAILLGMGLYAVAIHDKSIQGTVFLVAGMICFIPGAYHVVYVYLAARGFRGYDFYHLPLFT